MRFMGAREYATDPTWCSGTVRSRKFAYCVAYVVDTGGIIVGCGTDITPAAFPFTLYTFSFHLLGPRHQGSMGLRISWMCCRSRLTNENGFVRYPRRLNRDLQLQTGDCGSGDGFSFSV